MGTVLEFGSRAPVKPPDEPYLAGACVCVGCGHEWDGVAPVGTQTHCFGEIASSMECPKCTSLKGIFKKHAYRSSAPTWHCTSCKGFLFSVVLLDEQPCISCAACGDLRNAIDLFNK